MLAALPFRTSSVDVPAGMAAALEQTVHERGIPAVGIWAQVPHYVASMSYPAASVALLDGLATATGVRVEATELRRESVLQRERLDQLVEGNDEHQAMIAQFERLYDAADDAVRRHPSEASSCARPTSWPTRSNASSASRARTDASSQAHVSGEQGEREQDRRRRAGRSCGGGWRPSTPLT